MRESGAKDQPFGSAEWESRAINGNADWIRARHREGYEFIDIGIDSDKVRSPFYAAEKQTLHQVGAKVWRGAPKPIEEVRSKAGTSNRPPSKVLCPLK